MIWFKDIRFIFNKNIIPSKDLPLYEQLNSLMRFSIIFSTITYLIKRDVNAYLFVIFMGIFTAVLYYIDENKKINEQFYLNENDLYVDKLTGKTCRLPTKDNPFMNIIVEGNNKEHCDTSDLNVKSKIDKYFNEGLLRNETDIFNKESSDRQWYTVPIRNVDAFATWCYARPPSCKENNGYQCYTNLRN